MNFLILTYTFCICKIMNFSLHSEVFIVCISHAIQGTLRKKKKSRTQLLMCSCSVLFFLFSAQYMASWLTAHSAEGAISKAWWSLNPQLLSRWNHSSQPVLWHNHYSQLFLCHIQQEGGGHSLISMQWWQTFPQGLETNKIVALSGTCRKCKATSFSEWNK